ncbi:phosphotransferase enzyme family protein, partial [Cribrihabitans sp. XS_ASV171]
LVAQRENAVWRVDHAGRAHALRFHRPGYRTEAELRSELQWMAMLAESGLTVPRPIPQRNGAFIGRAGGHCVSQLTWLDGHPIGATGQLAQGLDPRDLSRRIGTEMARLHDLTDAWTPPQGFIRPDWRAEGLLGEAPLWGRFWEHPDLAPDHRDLFLRVRDAARAELSALEPSLDTGLIHADLLAENVMEHEGQVAFIDFDDCALGYRDFELATFLLKFRDRDYYPDLRAGLLEGYAARRVVEARALDLMLLLRALTYPGWIIARLEEPGGRARSDRAIRTALDLAETYLKGRT